MRRVRKLLSHAANVWHAAQGRNRLQRRSGTEPRPGPARGSWTEAAAGSNKSPRARPNFSLALAKTGEGRRVWKGKCRSGDEASHPIKWKRPARWRHAWIDPGEELNKAEMVTNRPTPDPAKDLTGADPFHHGESRIGHGSVLIAAITSCTNTSNPSVMLAAGLLAKKAVERGMRVDPAVKTSLALGSRVVSDYLTKT